ncbi:hypothetical protein [Alkalihalobacillus sp. AL-G]|nr:hypothetical protein [Alkalihalobacillus sp. AL-G]WLD95494.1 hypothetical protein MOJ78_03755 [Alkalihalobacillus sp. AL-G]
MMAIMIVCPKCRGSGQISSFLSKKKTCAACSGTGKIKSMSPKNKV